MEIIGSCPICDRDLWKGPRIDRHHFMTKCKGGRETEYVHKICHRKIHSLFTESELAKEYYDPEKVKAHPEIQKFISWVKKKEPDFYDRNKDHNRKKR